MYTYTRFLVVALLGACVADGDPPIEAEVHTSAIQHPDSPEEVGNEAIRLYEELAARLEERGVTHEDMQAAVDAGDAERVRELFGYTPEELAAANERLQAVGIMAAEIAEPPEDPDGLVCNNGALVLCTITAAERALRYPHAALIVFVIGEGVCALILCYWDRTDPGPGRQPS